MQTAEFIHRGTEDAESAQREYKDKLNGAVVKVLQMPEMKAKFELSGAAPAPTTPEQFAARIAQEDTSWSKVVREANIKGK